MNILIITTDYPRPDGHVSLQYIHSRNRLYIDKVRDIDITVLSFAASCDYTIDGISVLTLNTYIKHIENWHFDILLSHAPNIRNHYKFLKQYGNRFKEIIFFFHGHEILRRREIYPRNYDYMTNRINPLNIYSWAKASVIINDWYDLVKLKIWYRYFRQMLHKSHFVFVSNWMYDMFIKYVHLNPEMLNGKKCIIYNCVGKQFEINSYDFNVEKEYDFITIRSMLDGSKYAIDIVTEIAAKNPTYKFCVIGRGQFYKFNKKPDNLIWLDRHLSHDETIMFLNKSKVALMPTRTDAQGVMACEMATFGIPLITSDIDVCKEIFSGFKNVRFIENANNEIKIEPLFDELRHCDFHKSNRYFADTTIGLELDLIKSLMKE